ncbi:HNH endonuclease [Bradyrhizobium sp. Lot11]
MANCKGCGVPITPKNDSDAHMIPRALGGRLAPRGIICRDCNGKLNDAADFELIDALARGLPCLTFLAKAPTRQRRSIRRRATAPDWMRTANSCGPMSSIT